MSRITIHSHVDKRVARTRALLAEALMSLGAEHGIDGLEVSDLIGEAGVARSTFYAHYAGKDDFLIRSFVNMLAATDAAYRRALPDHTEIIPSGPLLRHVHDSREFALRVVQSEVFPHQMAAGEAKLREIAEANIARAKSEWTSEQRREAAVYIAGGFIGLLRWWMQTGLKQTPDQMQAAFARLTACILEDAA